MDLRCILRFVMLFALLPACDGEGAAPARRAIRETHRTEVVAAIHEDLSRHRQGVREAAERLSPGFLVEDAAVRERQMRTALKYVQEPPRGIGAFISSPMSFLAAVGVDGKVIARDADPDKMRGADFGKRYDVVRRVLAEGGAGYDLGEFESDDGESSVSMLFVHAVERGGERVGAVVAGIPLWRLSQRLSRQMKANHGEEEGLILWAYVYRGDRLFHFGTPPDLDALVPDHAARQAGLGRSPGGFTGETLLFGKRYGFGVVPVPSVGQDVGVVLFRSDPS